MYDMFPVVINSAATDGTVSGNGSNFTVRFPRGLQLPSKPNYTWHGAVARCTYTNSTKNVTAKFRNNKFYYSVDSGVTYKTIVFPNGYYQTEQLSKYIIAEIKANGDNLPGDLSPIRIEPNGSTMRTILYIDPAASTYRVKFEATEYFGLLIGFAAGVYSGINEGDLSPDINRGIRNLYIMSDTLVAKNACYRNGLGASILFALPTGGEPGKIVHYEPNNLMWVPMAKSDNDLINEASFMWIDALNRELDFSDQPTELVIYLWHRPDD